MLNVTVPLIFHVVNIIVIPRFIIIIIIIILVYEVQHVYIKSYKNQQTV